MNEFIEQFIIEARELVEQASSALSTLEAKPRDAAALDALFRALHTLKGGAGIVDFVVMERLLHDTESRLSSFKSGAAPVSAQANADTIACLDLVGRWLDAMEQSGALPAAAEAQAAALRKRFDAPAQASAVQTPQDGARALLESQLALLEDLPRAGFAGRVAAAGTAAANVFAWRGQPEVAARIRQALTRSLETSDAGQLQDQIRNALAGDATADAAPAETFEAAPRADSATRTLRIDAARVEQLVRLVGELTVIRNALGHTASLAQAEANALAGRLKEQHGALDRITSEIQATALGMRVVPLRSVLGRFPPVLRELAANLGKPAKLVIEGDATEADKTVVEALFEPLLHVVRNALDHGIETPPERARLGKPPVATVAMRAAREGDRVLVEIEDDGAGIDVARVGKVAVERGVVTAEALEQMSAADVMDLVFAPGFSTARQVTEVSGRGVGMDAVRTAVGRIGGTVVLESRAGAGTTVRFSLPFSVMMTHVMTVEAGGQTFGIPLDSVVETLRVPAASLSGVGAAHALAHRDRTLPVFELAGLLQVQRPRAVDAAEAVIVVVAVAGQWGGIRVDRAGERMEVMLKPLEGLLSGLPGITGTTIMGDGGVLLVLDPEAVLQ